MTITNPLALTLLLPAVIGYIWLLYQPAGAPGRLPGGWRRLVAPALTPFMTRHVLPGSALSLTLLLAIWTVMAFALARPSIENAKPSAFTNIAGRVVVLDLGTSADVYAQRLAVAKLTAASPRIPTALIVATADAFNVVPLTTDHGFIDRYLNVIHPDIMPVAGRSLAVMIAHGEAVLAGADIIAGQLVVLTGGAPPQGQVAPATHWERTIVVDANGRQAWRAYADRTESRLAIFDDLDPLIADFDRVVERARRDSSRDAHLDLRPHLIGTALLLWLFMFRHRKT